MWQQDEPRKPVSVSNPVLFWNPRGRVVAVQPNSVAKIMADGWDALTPDELRQYRAGDYVASRDSKSSVTVKEVASNRPEAVPAAYVTTVNLAPKPPAPKPVAKKK